LVAFAHRLSPSLSYTNAKMIAQLFREAIDLDPGNAEAFAGLSHALIVGGMMGNLRIPEAYVSAKEALERAIELDVELVEVRCAAAWLKLVSSRDWLGARRDFDDILNRPLPSRRAIVGRALLHIAEGSPGEASGLLRGIVLQSALDSRAAALYSWSRYLAGDCREALDLIEEARCSGHCGPVLDAVEALASVHCEEPDAYVARMQILAIDSVDHELLRGILGYALALNGKIQQANEVLDAITRAVDSRRSADPYAVALILIALGEKQDAVQWLERSYRRGSLWSLGFSSDPILQSLRDEPSYRAFLGRTNYPVPSRHRQQKDSFSAAAAEKGLLDSGA
jgi:serine/threonine-protein kinase